MICYINFLHLDSNIPTAQVYISQHICYAWACSLYSDFLQGIKLLSPGFLKIRLTFKKNYI